MRLSPEEYGAYWAGAIRIAAGVVLVILVYRAIGTFLNHPEVLAQVFGWALLILAILAGAFLVSLGVARIVRGAVAAERRS